MSETMVVPGGAFGKQLANSDKKVRDRAVRGLQKWLISNEELTDLQLLKLWKGLFYCFWMSDKPMIQEHLADKLAAVVMKLPEGNGLRYMKAFWTIMIKEWHGIDRLRLDKFYMLLRKFHFYGFRYLQTKEWEQSVVEQYLNLLIKGPLRPNDLKVPDGLRYHTSEVYLDELRKAVSSEPSKETKVQLLQPFFVNLASSASDTVFSRIQDNIFKSILKQALSGACVGLRNVQGLGKY
ncbi:uncharacterized protein EV422DRAFT_144812 [Fimicolochytrium jonesii]|uniref:uncharacterized protein n=1 Tax=Fimicolochytrium jonesii TaxID=1396493 RepID=UPI0022FE973A|nr:uncharacterized protein EV422DRAFT_144812 [Fimicolochytrium jonesii]KAI8825878.1 hypothetical protein EV422DRAFT_144812 [Fimicolochytrium jonesii]